ncbi:GNAT family N-acetyltransferase [Jeongeupia sp. USM3]|nr:GNAT family N-acetyltransferase [Jeongeupia sp. USM3]
MDVRPVADGEDVWLFEIHRTVFRSHIEQIWGWDEVWQQGNFASELASSKTSVIRIDTGIAGYVQVCDEDLRIYIRNIALLPEFRRKGVGTRLIKALQAAAAARGVPLALGVFRTNAAARQLYERLGFVNTSETTTHIEMVWLPA